jgi:putative RecB family exonuclease
MEEWEKSGRAMATEDVVDLAVADYDRRIAEQREIQPDDSGWLTGGRTKVQTDIDRRRDRVAAHTRGYIAYSLEHEHEFRPAELPDGRPAVEVPWELEMNGVIVRGFTDLVLKWADGQHTIRDLKTGNKLPSDPLQLAFYALAWEKYFGDRIEYGDFYMCKNDLPTEMFYLGDYPEAVMAAWVEMMHRSERSGIYLPNGGDFCRVCTVRKYCSLMGASEKQAYLMPTMKGEST